jgi:ankyrin repeat protein
LIEIELIKANAETDKIGFLEKIGFIQPKTDYFRFLGALLDLKKTYSLEKAIGTELYATLAGRAFSGATIIPEQLRKYYLSVVSSEALFENRFFRPDGGQHEDKKDKPIETQDFPRLKLSLEEQPGLLESEDENGSTLLHHASYAGNEEAVQFLVDKGANVNARATSCSWTPLFLASLSGHTEIVKLLIENGARIDVKDNRGRSPLHHAAALCGKSQAASLLLLKGAAVDAEDHQGQTPLHLASLNGSRDLVRLLIMEGIDIDKRDIFGKTPLHIAAFCGHNDVVELLIESGADPYTQNKYGITPMEIASKAGHRKIFARLREIAAALN